MCNRFAPAAMNVFCFGLSHRTAGVDIRERFAIAECDLPGVVGSVGALPGIAESVIISTCNRVEFYAAGADSMAGLDALRDYLGCRTGIGSAGLNGSAGDLFPASVLPDGVAHPFYTLEGPDSIAHLFRVVCGLDSMVIGETEILGQVKKAYAAASAAGGTSRHLNKLFQRAFNVAKEVRTKTCITRGPVSVGSVAVDLAERIFGELKECRALVLGAGEMSELTARALQSRGVKKIVVANRSYERAAALAADLGGEAEPFERWEQRLGDTDILISSTAAPHAVVTREQVAPVMHSRPERPLFVIDLAVPRDVEPGVNDLEGAFVYDIDSLQAIARQGIETRRREIAVCEAMIERHVSEFVRWLGGGNPARPV